MEIFWEGVVPNLSDIDSEEKIVNGIGKWGARIVA